MWWRKKKNKGPLVPDRTALNNMAVKVVAEAKLNFDSAAPLEQALVGTFLFGMIYAYCAQRKMTPPEVHALALIVFVDSLHYTEQAAAEGVQNCINASKPGYHDTMNTILHRGIDAHRQYEAGDFTGLGENIRSVLSHFKKRERLTIR